MICRSKYTLCSAPEIRRLLVSGLDVNAEAHDGLTPLMAAAAERPPEIRAAEVLLAEGAFANASTGPGRRPFTTRFDSWNRPTRSRSTGRLSALGDPR
jgi:ankyrin repeat protein